MDQRYAAADCSACGWTPSRSHLDSLLRFAARAYRRPLSQAEHEEMLTYYRTLREKDGLTHEEAIRDLIVSVLMSPKFCYRLDLGDAPLFGEDVPAAAGAGQPLSSYSLASRLSYFLWSSMPDEELLAARGRESAKTRRPDRPGEAHAEG